MVVLTYGHKIFDTLFFPGGRALIPLPSSVWDELSDLVVDQHVIWNITLKEFEELSSIDSINPRWESAYLCKQRLSALNIYKNKK